MSALQIQIGSTARNSYLEKGIFSDNYSILTQDFLAIPHIANRPKNLAKTNLNKFNSVVNFEAVEPIRGTSADETLIGGQDNDTIRGLGGDDYLVGLEGRDFLAGGKGNDKLKGNLDRDTLSGGAGDDTLIGGGKIDILYGGEGRDTFVLQSNRGKDFIMDFELGIDILRLSDDLTLDSLTFESDLAGTGTLIRNSEGNAIAVLKNIPLGSLTTEFEDPNEPDFAFEGFPYLSNFLELSNGLKMHYLDEGSDDGDTIVLLHGQPTSSFLWRNIIPELAERGRVIVPDLINFGLSDKTETPLDFVEDHGALFSEFIDSLGLEDITLVGHDWGGAIQLSYAVDNPENIKALALMESFAVPFPDASVVSAFPPQFVEAFWSDPVLSETNIIDRNLFIEGWLFDPAFGGIANPLTEAEKEVYRQPFLNPEAREQLAISPRQLPFLDATGYPILDPDGIGGLPPEPVPNIDQFGEFANYLATTDVPRLLIYGNPGFAAPELVLSLAAAVPGIEVQEIGSAENPVFHFIQEDAPEELSTILGEWIDSINQTPEPPPEVTQLKVTVENLAPENGIGFAAVWFGLHDGSFDFFNQGEPTSEALEILAEDGLIGLEELLLPGILEETVAAGLDITQLPLAVQQAIALGLDLSTLPPPPGTLAGEFLLSDAGANGGTQGMVVTSIRTNPELFDLLDDPSAFPQEVLDSITNPFFFIQASGETESFTVTLNGTPEANRYLSYASMLFPTNDGFIGNDNPQAIEIFDESGNFIGANFIVTGEQTWDAGTEVNDELPESLLYTWEAFGNGTEQNGTIESHPGFFEPGAGGVLDFEFNDNLVAANADFTVPNYPIARITVTAVEEPDTPNEPIVGTVNDDTLEVNGRGQFIFAGAGNDTIDASQSEGDNRIFGGTGNDTLILGRDDVLAGGAGEDIFLSQTGGNNRITGGADADQFWIAVAEFPENPQIIEDLELDIDEIVMAGIGASSVADLNFNQDGGNAIISFGNTELAIFADIDSNQLASNGNFRFINE